MMCCFSLNDIIVYFDAFIVPDNWQALLAGGTAALALLLALCVRWLLRASAMN